MTLLVKLETERTLFRYIFGWANPFRFGIRFVGKSVNWIYQVSEWSRDQFYHMMISRDHIKRKHVYFLGLKRLEHLNYGTFGCLTEI